MFRSEDRKICCCEVVEKGDIWPQFLGVGDTPDFGHEFSNCTHFRTCGRFWLSSVQRARRVADEKRRWKIEEDRLKQIKTP